MGAIASLENALVTVAPGSESSVEIKVRNNGSVVDQMTLSVLGEAAAWSTIDPASLSLFPGAEGTARLTFRPPRDSAVPAGRMAFGARVASQEDPAGSVVEEGRLDIAPFHEVSAELQPRTSRGSRGARHDIAIDNRGNVPLNATISGADADQALGFDIDPPSVEAEPGQVAFARVDVKTTKRFWRGQPQTRAFMLQVEPAGAPPLPIDGSLLQEPMLPPWLLKALAAMAAIVIALAALWFLVLQPSVLTAAETRAEEVLQDAGIEVPPDGGGGNGGGNGDGGGGDGGTDPLDGATGDPADGRLEANRGSVTPSDGRSLFLTDLIFSNPGAEEGPVRLQRNGETLLDLRLENFRDLDFHFITPIMIGTDDRLTLECPRCDSAAVFYSGYER